MPQRRLELVHDLVSLSLNYGELVLRDAWHLQLSRLLLQLNQKGLYPAGLRILAHLSLITNVHCFERVSTIKEVVHDLRQVLHVVFRAAACAIHKFSVFSEEGIDSLVSLEIVEFRLDLGQFLLQRLNPLVPHLHFFLKVLVLEFKGLLEALHDAFDQIAQGLVASWQHRPHLGHNLAVQLFNHLVLLDLGVHFLRAVDFLADLHLALVQEHGQVLQLALEGRVCSTACWRVVGAH